MANYYKKAEQFARKSKKRNGESILIQSDEFPSVCYMLLNEQKELIILTEKEGILNISFEKLGKLIKELQEIKEVYYD